MVVYEWDVEIVCTVDCDEYEADEILEHNHTDSYKDAVRFAKSEPPSNCMYAIVLVRDDDRGRSWAYLDNGRLPVNFLDAYDRPTAKVPARFHKEVLVQ